MGRPRLIIIIRHAQSEGNLNRAIHQTVPDHRVKLTEEGWNQARDAGRRLRSLLKPSDTLRVYTSPYRRTRETTDGILQTLTSDDPEPTPFPRNTIKVWEEPRLREQDFGNFQPNSAAMEKMWKERAEYGHFFYRIPNGESAADAYDRISGFNETLFRSFQEEDFPSVCILVTHGLMSRVFLMRWYHWSVEFFEDLRNVNHCEMVMLKRTPDSLRFKLQNELRTWSELKRRAAVEREQGKKDPSLLSPVIPARRWGESESKADDRPATQQPKVSAEARLSAKLWQPKDTPTNTSTNLQNETTSSEEDEEAFPRITSKSHKKSRGESDVESHPIRPQHPKTTIPSYMDVGRDFGGSSSGAATPRSDARDEGDSTNLDSVNDRLDTHRSGSRIEQLRQHAPGSDEDDSENEAVPGHDSVRTPSDEVKQRWSAESGMGSGARADALGDYSEDDMTNDDHDDDDGLLEAEKEDKSLRGSVY